MILIIGLGNPGKKYEKTRHNVGFQAVDILAKKEKWTKSKKNNCFYIKKQINNKNVELIKPMTFMNDSGKAIKSVQKKHNTLTKEIIVIHDDIDIPVGTIRISENSSSAGHKGVQSIIQELGTKEFIRIRIGIRQETNNFISKTPIEKFVLKRFSLQEKKEIEKSINLSVQAISFILEKGVAHAMAEYN